MERQLRRHRLRGGLRLIIGVGAAIPLAAATAALPAVAAPAGTTYHVDCGASATGADGSSAHPFASLQAVNLVALHAGDSVLFARGSTCVGTLTPNGSGSSGAPVVIGAYGDGAAPKIDGNGAHDAVLLDNVDNITVQDLDLTNAANPGTERTGIRIHLKDFGKASGFVLQRLNIHDVMGDDNKGVNGSAAIQVGIDGSATPTWIDGLQILDNTITHSGREGIYTKSTWNKRPEVGTQDTSGLGPWTPSTGVVISGNTLTSIAGDGIKIDTTQGAVIEHNVLNGFQLRSSANNAGIWPFNSDDTVVQYNDVSGGGSAGDGMSFDADGGSQRTIFQYNYSHDNVGGLLLVCPYSGAKTYGTIMRYNVSINDGRGSRLFQLCPGDIDQTQIYNNTIIDDTVTPTYFLQDDNSTRRGVSWHNNIVVNRGAAMSTQVRGAGLEFDHNVLIGVTGVPANADGSTNPGGSDADPGFVDEAHVPTGMDDLAGVKLRAGSPALGAGAAVSDNGGLDYFGTSVPDGAVNIGAYQGPGIVTADPATIRLPAVSVVSGTSTIVKANLTWWGAKPTAGLTASLAAPAGWRVVAAHAIVPDGVAPGASVELSWKVSPPATVQTGSAQLTVSASAGGTVLGTASTTATVTSLYPDIESAFNDVAITADGANPYTGDLALSESSLSANEMLKEKGIQSGATVQGGKVTYTWPEFTPGEKNAVWAGGQSIAVDGQGDSLGFVTIGVNAYPTAVSGKGSVTYTDGTTSSFTLATGDYYYNNLATGSSIFATMSYRNTPTGKGTGKFSLFESTVPLDDTKTVAFVTLPALPAYSDGKTPGMLVLAMGIGGAAAEPTPDGPVTVSEPKVHPGDKVTFSAEGFYDSERVTGTVHSDPIDLGATNAAAGKASLTWTVPADFELGSHEVTLTGADSGAVMQSTFDVVAAPSEPGDGGDGGTSGGSTGSGGSGGSTGGGSSAGSHGATSDDSSLASTGSDITVGASLAALALLSGAGMLAARRRRRKA